MYSQVLNQQMKSKVYVLPTPSMIFLQSQKNHKWSSQKFGKKSLNILQTGICEIVCLFICLQFFQIF
jgi:hypothetical protein